MASRLEFEISRSSTLRSRRAEAASSFSCARDWPLDPWGAKVALVGLWGSETEGCRCVCGCVGGKVGVVVEWCCRRGSEAREAVRERGAGPEVVGEEGDQVLWSGVCRLACLVAVGVVALLGKVLLADLAESTEEMEAVLAWPWRKVPAAEPALDLRLELPSTDWACVGGVEMGGRIDGRCIAGRMTWDAPLR